MAHPATGSRVPAWAESIPATLDQQRDCWRQPCLIIHTIRRNPSGPVWIDDPSNVSRPVPSGADQIDAEHQATDLVVWASDP